MSLTGRVLVAGCGDVGTLIALDVCRAGGTAWGVRRSVAGLEPPLRAVAADLTRPDDLIRLPEALDAIVFAASADSGDEDAYRRAYVDAPRNVLDVVAGSRAERPRLLYLSSTAVHEHDDGRWIDEESLIAPVGFRGRLVREGERVVLESGLPGTVLRLGGIYGPGRSTRLVDRVRAGEARLPLRPRFTNRIHREDAATAALHVLGLRAPAPAYLGVDDEPADLAVVLCWLAERLGVAAPPHQEETSGRGEGKRCSNALLRATGWTPRYPTFREGYAALLQTSD